MPDAPLNARQAAFVREYLLDLNGTQAAIRAGYSPKTAEQQASVLLRNPKVAPHIAAAQEARAKRTDIDADWVLRRLASEAEADMADLYEPDGSLKPVETWPLIWRQGLVAGVEVEEIMAEGVKVAVVRKVKLSDRIKRIELIGKHVNVQAFKEKVEHSGAVTLVVDGDDAELS